MSESVALEIRQMSAADIAQSLPLEEAVTALETVFRDRRGSHTPLRTVHEIEGGHLIVMPSAAPTAAGIKIVTVCPENPSRGMPLIGGIFALFAAETLQPLAIMEGAALTAVRTGALSALATKYLARDDASRLVVFGAGVQARSHIEFMRAVRPITSVQVVEPAQDRGDDLLRWALDKDIGVEIAGPDAVAEADIICTCSTSPTPVFDGSLLPDGVHINAIGAYTPETRELDSDTVANAVVVVEDREVALAEAGDLVIPIGEGRFDRDHIKADLSELVSGWESPSTENGRTLFKAVGAAFEDLAVAEAVYRSAA